MKFWDSVDITDSQCLPVEYGDRRLQASLLGSLGSADGAPACDQEDYRCDLPTGTDPQSIDHLKLVFWFDSTAPSEPKPAVMKKINIDGTMYSSD